MPAHEIVMGTPTAKALEGAVQKKLADFGYSSADDPVMAEYVVVMVANSKTAEDISQELKELIGEDLFDTSFTTWLFEEVASRFGSASTSGPAATAPADSSAQVPSSSADDGRDGREDWRNNSNGRESRNGQGGVFNQAVGGLKRPTDGYGARDAPPHRRMRMDDPSFSGSPTGPRHFNDKREQGQNTSPLNGDRRNRDNMRGGRGGPRMMNGPQRSLLDRTGGPHPGSFPNMNHNNNSNNNNGNAGYDPVMQNQMMMQQQMMGMGLQYPPHGAPQPPHQFFPPNQQFRGPPPVHPPFAPFPGAQTPQLYLANGQPFVPPGFPMPAPPAVVPAQQVQPARPDLSTLPKKPDGQECKFGYSCKNAWCSNAHVTPAGDKTSLMLSFEPCEKQIECQDKECTKAHVSRQQKDVANSVWTKPAPVLPTPPTTVSTAPSVPVVMAPAPRNIGVAANATPCRFGVGCTRPDCIFTHPWNSKPGGQSYIPCKFGIACTRPDCHFGHPPSRNLNRTSKNVSMSFTKKVGGETIGEMPATEESKINRLKRFAGAVDPDDVERIIPGESGNSEQASGQDKSEEKKTAQNAGGSSPVTRIVGE